jgi:hypothetical protein
VDDFQSFLVVLDGSDEQLVAVALVVEEHFDLSVDLVLSEFVPGDVVLGGNKFLLESNSVLLGSNEKFLVQVLDFSEFGDGTKIDRIASELTQLQSIRQFRSFCQQRIEHRSWTT